MRISDLQATPPDVHNFCGFSNSLEFQLIRYQRYQSGGNGAGVPFAVFGKSTSCINTLEIRHE